MEGPVHDCSRESVGEAVGCGGVQGKEQAGSEVRADFEESELNMVSLQGCTA